MLGKLIIFLSISSTAYAGPSNIVRPCHYTNTVCLRENLAANSNCNPTVRGSIPGEYSIGRFPFETPYFNASYIDNNLIIRNHNKCVTSEFFYNVQADTLVLSIDCPFLEFDSH
ncbi:unnamed protein product [Leptidea sinapis]|uniref:Uncharacterized protein n=1 Tax=Leptidea sinapis TaxID=189913 RepID=A0A5E4QUJ2_9NEOP|nr:unnamed protein product [Leptidea sinapis]